MPTYSIPYALNESEIRAFLIRHPEVNSRIVEVAPGNWSGLGDFPPYGIIVDEAYGQFLVWIDATFRLHVIDVTNLAIVGAVQQAPFQSPDDEGFWSNFWTDLQEVSIQAAHTGMDILSLLALVSVAVLVIYARR